MPCVGFSFTFARVLSTRCAVCRFKLFICSRVGRYLGVPWVGSSFMFARVSGFVRCAYGGACSFARVFTTFWCTVCRF